LLREDQPKTRKKTKRKSTTLDSVFQEGLPEVQEKIETKSTTQNLISTNYSGSSFKKPINSSANNVKPLVEDISLRIPGEIPTKLNNIRVSKLKLSVPQDSTSEFVKTISVSAKQRKQVNNLNAILNKVSNLQEINNFKNTISTIRKNNSKRISELVSEEYKGVISPVQSSTSQNDYIDSRETMPVIEKVSSTHEGYLNEEGLTSEDLKEWLEDNDDDDFDDCDTHLFLQDIFEEETKPPMMSRSIDIQKQMDALINQLELSMKETENTRKVIMQLSLIQKQQNALMLPHFNVLEKDLDEVMSGENIKRIQNSLLR